MLFMVGAKENRKKWKREQRKEQRLLREIKNH